MQGILRWMWTGMLAALGSPLVAQPPLSLPSAQMPATQPLFSAGIIADAQYCDCDPFKGRYFRISKEKLEVAVETFNVREVDLVINLGDLIDNQLKSYPGALQPLSELQMPIYHVLGNHEFWEVPYNLQKTVLDSLDLGSNYCAVDRENWRLLMLDGTDLAEYASGAHPETREEAENYRLDLDSNPDGKLWNGALGQTQMDWMEYQIADAASKGMRVALFCHFPISPNPNYMRLWNHAEIRKKIGRYPNVETWLSGHAHEGGYHFLDDIHHLILQGMLMTPDSNAFGILHFFEDHLELEGFGREQSRILLSTMDFAEPACDLPMKEYPQAIPQAPAAPACQMLEVFDAMGQRRILTEFEEVLPGLEDYLGPGIFKCLTREGDSLRSATILVNPAD